MIYILNKASPDESRKIRKLITKKSKKRDVFSEVYQFIQSQNGFDYARKRMNEYSDEALKILDAQKDNTYKSAIRDLIYFNLDRKK